MSKLQPGCIFLDVKLQLFASLFLAISTIQGAALSDHLKLALKSEVDFGHVVKGVQSESGREIDMLPLNRNIVTIGTQAKFNENWSLEAGFRNILWWPFGGTGDMPHERIVRVESQLSIARMTGHFGSLTLDAGYFTHKNNRDARNLGEYLHRSGTYPGYLVTTEDWQLMNEASPQFYGVRASYTQAEGRVKHDLTFFLETEVNPVGDISPGYEISLNFGLLDLGGGVALNHYLSFHPSQLQPNTSDDKNVYVEVAPFQPASGPPTAAYAGPLSDAPFAVKEAVAADSLQIITLRKSRWTHEGIKLMGRAALNLGGFLPEGLLGPDDLRLFTEVAVLGWENHPYFYESRQDRMPIMVGFNLPTFKLLDLLSVQVERYTSPHNSSAYYSDLSLPIWKERLDENGSKVQIAEDDWKWSVFAKKRVNRLFAVYLQVANDHLRTLRYDQVKSESSLTQAPSHWYYLAKLEFGI